MLKKYKQPSIFDAKEMEANYKDYWDSFEVIYDILNHRKVVDIYDINIGQLEYNLLENDRSYSKGIEALVEGIIHNSYPEAFPKTLQFLENSNYEISNDTKQVIFEDIRDAKNSYDSEDFFRIFNQFVYRAVWYFNPILPRYEEVSSINLELLPITAIYDASHFKYLLDKIDYFNKPNEYLLYSIGQSRQQIQLITFRILELNYIFHNVIKLSFIDSIIEYMFGDLSELNFDMFTKISIYAAIMNGIASKFYIPLYAQALFRYYKRKPLITMASSNNLKYQY